MTVLVREESFQVVLFGYLVLGVESPLLVILVKVESEFPRTEAVRLCLLHDLGLLFDIG